MTITFIPPEHVGKLKCTVATKYSQASGRKTPIERCGDKAIAHIFMGGNTGLEHLVCVKCFQEGCG